MDEHRKFNMAEIVVGGLFTLTVDAVAALLDFVPAIGWMIASIIQAGTSFGTSMWLRTKGGKRAFGLERQLIKQASNLLPWVPTCFASFLIEAALHNNPKVAGLARAGAK